MTIRDFEPERRVIELSMNPPLKAKGGAPAKPKADPSRCGARDDSVRGEGDGRFSARMVRDENNARFATLTKNAGLKPGAT
jgi:hypothetical protein